MSLPEQKWDHEAHDDGTPDFGFGPAHFTLNVSGGQVTIVIGSDYARVTQEQQIAQGDWNALEQSLHQYGLAPGEIAELKAALSNDDERIGDTTRTWLGRLSEKVADGTLPGVAVDVVVKLIRGFLGI